MSAAVEGALEGMRVSDANHADGRCTFGHCFSHTDVGHQLVVLVVVGAVVVVVDVVGHRQPVAVGDNLVRISLRAISLYPLGIQGDGCSRLHVKVAVLRALWIKSLASSSLGNPTLNPY